MFKKHHILNTITLDTIFTPVCIVTILIEEVLEYKIQIFLRSCIAIPNNAHKNLHNTPYASRPCRFTL